MENVVVGSTSEESIKRILIYRIGVFNNREGKQLLFHGGDSLTLVESLWIIYPSNASTILILFFESVFILQVDPSTTWASI
jgi:hypothetical protein